MCGESAPTIYFAYGSNLCPEQMARRCPGGQALGQAALHNWRGLINTRTYATIEAKPGSVTHGVLWSLTPGHVAALDELHARADVLTRAARDALDGAARRLARLDVRQDVVPVLLRPACGRVLVEPVAPSK